MHPVHNLRTVYTALSKGDRCRDGPARRRGGSEGADEVRGGGRATRRHGDRSSWKSNVWMEFIKLIRLIAGEAGGVAGRRGRGKQEGCVVSRPRGESAEDGWMGGGWSVVVREWSLWGLQSRIRGRQLIMRLLDAGRCG